MAKVQEHKQQNYVTTISQKDLGIKTEEAPTLGTSAAFSLWIRSLLQNWRQGTVSCKGRSDVNRSGKKPWKQKGTGRARVGSARSPLWRGGGIIFGPQPRTAKRKVSKNVKKMVYGSFLHAFLSQGKVLSLDWSIKNDEPNTKAVYELLKNANLSDKKLLIFLPMEDLVTYASLRNLPNVQLVFFDQPNAFDLAKNDFWVFFKKDLNNFKEMVSRWLAAS